MNDKGTRTYRLEDGKALGSVAGSLARHSQKSLRQGEEYVGGRYLNEEEGKGHVSRARTYPFV